MACNRVSLIDRGGNSDWSDPAVWLGSSVPVVVNHSQPPLVNSVSVRAEPSLSFSDWMWITFRRPARRMPPQPWQLDVGISYRYWACPFVSSLAAEWDALGSMLYSPCSHVVTLDFKGMAGAERPSSVFLEGLKRVLCGHWGRSAAYSPDALWDLIEKSLARRASGLSHTLCQTGCGD